MLQIFFFNVNSQALKIIFTNVNSISKVFCLKNLPNKSPLSANTNSKKLRPFMIFCFLQSFQLQIHVFKKDDYKHTLIL